MKMEQRILVPLDIINVDEDEVKTVRESLTMVVNDMSKTIRRLLADEYNSKSKEYYAILIAESEKERIKFLKKLKTLLKITDSDDIIKPEISD